MSNRSLAAATLALVLSSMLTPASARAQAAAPAQPPNPSFEAGLSGWQVSGRVGSSKLESAGHESPTRHTQWSEAEVHAKAVTEVRLARGTYTLNVWVQGGGPQPAASSVGVRGCGPSSRRAVPTTVQDGQWVRLSVPFTVTRRSTCGVVLATDGPAQSWASFDDIALTSGNTAARRVRGADLSSVPKNEAMGAAYYDVSGRRVLPERELAAAGANVGRLKVFVNPADGFNEQSHVVAMARRLRAAGMRVLIDFHYSDTGPTLAGRHSLPPGGA